jgi:hypothetical protein
LSCRVLSCLVLSCLVWRRVVLCRVCVDLSCLVLSCRALRLPCSCRCVDLSCLVPSCPVLRLPCDCLRFPSSQYPIPHSLPLTPIPLSLTLTLTQTPIPNPNPNHSDMEGTVDTVKVEKKEPVQNHFPLQVIIPTQSPKPSTLPNSNPVTLTQNPSLKP